MRKRPKHEPTNRYFYLSIQIAKCMMKADAFSLHADLVRTIITDTQQILILHISDLEEIESKGIIVDETCIISVLRARSNQKESSSMKVYGGEQTRKLSQKCQHIQGKYVINKTEDEEPLLLDNPVIHERGYF